MLLVVVNDAAVGQNLLDVLVDKVDDAVAVGERLPLRPVWENDFLHVVVVNILDFPIAQRSVLDQFTRLF